MTSSMRRFLARPMKSRLSAIGRSAPKPCAVSRWPSTWPLSMSQRRTAAARARDSSSPSSGGILLSMWPSTRSFRISVCRFKMRATMPSSLAERLSTTLPSRSNSIGSNDDDAIADERGERGRLIGAAVVVVDAVPRLGLERALVEAIDVAVAVGVEVGAALVLLDARLVGAAIGASGTPSLIAIGRRRPWRLDRLRRALVGVVGHAVFVGVGRRRRAAHRRAHRHRPSRRRGRRRRRDVLDAEDGARAIGHAVAVRQADADGGVELEAEARAPAQAGGELGRRFRRRSATQPLGNSTPTRPRTSATMARPTRQAAPPARRRTGIASRRADRRSRGRRARRSRR